MNFEQIKHDCPKAIKALLSQYSGMCILESDLIYYIKDGINTVNNRILYDFFDDNEIFIEISFTYYNGTFFTYRIDRADDIDYGETCDTRPKAEIGAFTKAFEILEEKLSE